MKSQSTHQALTQIAQGTTRPPVAGMTTAEIERNKQCSETIEQVVKRQSVSNALRPPQQAFGIWG